MGNQMWYSQLPATYNSARSVMGLLMAQRGFTTTQFKAALQQIGKPGGRQLVFLQAHFSSPGRASTAAKLAIAASYKNHGGVNLHYGILAKRIGEALGAPEPHLGLLLEFNRPASLTNAHWILSMKPKFAEALSSMAWVK